MSHISISGNRVEDFKDRLGWALTKMFIIGGLLVSVPGVVAGTFVPAEGMTRTDTVLKNWTHDHTVVWEAVGHGFNEIVDHMNETNG